MKLDLQFITNHGKKEFVVLPYDQFIQMSEIIEDYEDIMDLRLAKEASKNDIGITIQELNKEILESV